MPQNTQGNNNAYCQDNTISWFDWNLPRINAELVEFTKALIRQRLNNPTLRRRTFLQGGCSEQGVIPDVEWFSPDGSHVDWFSGEPSLICFFGAPTMDQLIVKDDRVANELAGTPQHVLLFCNAGPQTRRFLFPSSPVILEMSWSIAVDTRQSHDQSPSPTPLKFDSSRPITLPERSLLCLTAPTTSTFGK
jgi:Type II secretory pathway, pullulanase PulA and related glycosidases